MKATGMIRKIDDLGRVVIPKEIRKTLRIREGDAMEIYVEKNGEIILKRYAPLGDIVDEAIILADVLAENTGLSVYITDNKTIIAANSKLYKSNVDRLISEELRQVLENRIVWVDKGKKPIKIAETDLRASYCYQIVSPIISDGDILGSIVLFSENGKIVIDIDSMLKSLKIATDFLKYQM